MARIQARKGRDGTVTIAAEEDLGEGAGFESIVINRAVVVMGDEQLDSDVDTDDIVISGNEITYKKGAFDVEEANYSVEVVVFTDGYPNGKTIIGRGYANSLVCEFRHIPIN